MRKIYYTGIGSRQTPDDILEEMRKFANTMAQQGMFVLRSGYAPGADKAFSDGVGKGKMEVYLPWPGFEGAPHNSYDNRFISLVDLPKDVVSTATDIAKGKHPRWDALSTGARKLHTRNVFQVLGKDLQSISDVIICYTEGGRGAGGTGQAIRIAKFLKVPIFDWGIRSNIEKSWEHMRKLYKENMR